MIDLVIPSLESRSPTPSPATVRRWMLEQHAQLRVLVLEAERLVRAVLQGNADGMQSLRTMAEALADALTDHLSAEESFALPALEDADAWGPERVRQLEEEHSGQRAAVAVLRRLVDSGPASELARGLDGLARALIRDMRQEEAELFTAEVLRDDAVALDQSDG